MRKLNELRTPNFPWWRWKGRCYYCGKFIPRAAYHSGYNWDVGAPSCYWDCPHCGEPDGYP